MTEKELKKTYFHCGLFWKVKKLEIGQRVKVTNIKSDLLTMDR